MRSRISAIAACAALWGMPALATSALIGAGDVAKIAAMARAHGEATVTEDRNGAPMIEGRIDGTIYVVHFYGCTGGTDCRDIQFRASWNTNQAHSIADMNEWNRTRRFGKAYLDSAGAPVIEMMVNLNHGVSPANLDDSIDWWTTVLESFRDEVINR